VDPLALAALGTFAVAWGLYSVFVRDAEKYGRPTSAERTTGRELAKHGFSNPFDKLYCSGSVMVQIRPKKSTVIVPTLHAPYGSLPPEADVGFAPDALLVHFETGAAFVEPALERAKALAQQYREAGHWSTAARAYRLSFRFASGLRHITGDHEGMEISIRQDGHRAYVLVDLAGQLSKRPWARAGKGDCGNPVLDMLIDSHGIPESEVERVLDLVHGRGGVIENGVLRVTWDGDMERCLETVISIGKALQS